MDLRQIYLLHCWGDQMDFSHLFYFIAASALLTLAPGPDILYLVSLSLGSGAKKGILLAAGLCSGLFFHTALAAFGVAAVISSSAFLYTLLKVLGAAYLLYLAWCSARAANEVQLKDAIRSESLKKTYLRGVMMNVLNPKVVLFFLAFLPQFVQADSSAAVWQVGFLGIVFAIQAFCIFCFTAVLAGAVRGRFLASAAFAKRMNWCQAVLLFGIGAALFMS